MSDSSPRKSGGTFELRVSDDDADVAYLRLPFHPGNLGLYSYTPGISSCKMARSVRLRDLMGDYDGPDVVLDFDLRGVLVGIEVLA
ncbi:DUF2283 domain-containing protein [Sorangium sp. So ce854]|uniref:DUF2283 domain-containing protein n=1 Tax=Sorangium sp. So ce854 TaxID=3133322 RepID=UPI003F5F6D12